MVYMTLRDAQWLQFAAPARREAIRRGGTGDQLRDIATLKLLSAPDRTNVDMVVTQALTMGGIDFLSGAVMIPSAYEHFPRRVVLRLDDGLALGLVVLLVCLLASGLSVRLTLRVDAAHALGG